MNLFGFNISRSSGRLRAEGTAFDRRTQLNEIYARAPLIPRAPANSEVTPGGRSVAQVMPPFGTNPPDRPLVEYDSPLDGRSILNDPRDLWYLALPSKLTPNQVSQILRSAQGGDIWQQFQLGQLMLDTWPMLRKCDHELRDAVSSVKYVAMPFCYPGQEPTKVAKAKADLINRCFGNLQPNQFTDERNFRGMVYQLAGAFLMGLSVEELIWTKPMRYPGIGQESRIRAAAFVHPRHFTFTDQGQLALFDEQYNRLYFNMAKVGQTPDPRKFVCAQYYSSSGSTLGAGFLRPLAWWWTAVVFNKEWMARMAQNYGAPFLDVVYKPGMSAQELSTLDNNIKQGLANRFIRHLEGTTLGVTPAQSLGAENPQRYLAEEADHQCQMLMLGQTLSSDTSVNGGSLAQGEVHMTVRQDRLEGIAKWVAGDPLAQIARAILLVNYNDTEECPEIVPDFSKPMTAEEQAAYLTSIGNCKIPVHAEEVYHKAGMSMPEEGDKVLIGGQIGLMSSQEVPVGLEADLERQEAEMEARAKMAKKVKARLATMTPEELRETERLVTAAERAAHPNGEWDAVKAKLEERE